MLPQTKQEILDLPVTPYWEARTMFRTGDILLCSGGGLLGSLIKRFSDSPYTHTGVIFYHPFWRRFLLAHSDAKGVRFLALSNYQRDYAGQLLVARNKALPVGTTDKMGAFASDHLGRRYDVDELVRIAYRVIRNKGREKRDQEFICSEFVADVFRAGGYEFTYDDRGFISPANIAQDKNMELVARIL